MKQLKFKAAGSITGDIDFHLGSCCGDIHDGISIEYGNHGPVIISRESLDVLMANAEMYFSTDEKCRCCGRYLKK
jgi:hypothetical protein